MKKKILTIAIALLAFTGISASAQQSRVTPTASETSAGANNKMRQPREFTEFAFEGVLLDINQQQRIDSLNAAVKANRPERPDRVFAAEKPGCKDAQCDKSAQCDKAGKCDKATKCDKAGKPCATDSVAKDRRGPKGPKSPRMMRNPYGEEYVAKVQEILTPDQFAIFQENISNMPMRMQNGKAMMKNGAKNMKSQMTKAKKLTRTADNASASE